MCRDITKTFRLRYLSLTMYEFTWTAYKLFIHSTMDNYLLVYITQRMAEMGYKTFHFEPVRVFANVNKAIIAAYNEHYYLVSKNVPAGLVIASDTNIFNEAANFSDFTYYQLQEFSGLIEISQPAAPIDIEFIKVVPELFCPVATNN